jgi:hypothetical protein
LVVLVEKVTPFGRQIALLAGVVIDGVCSFRLLPVTMTGALMRSCGKRRWSVPFP